MGQPWNILRKVRNLNWKCKKKFKRRTKAKTREVNCYDSVCTLARLLIYIVWLPAFCNSKLVIAQLCLHCKLWDFFSCCPVRLNGVHGSGFFLINTQDHSCAFLKSCLFLLPLKTNLCVTALVTVEQLVSVEDMPSAPLWEGR